MRSVLFLIFVLTFIDGYGQVRWFKLTGGFVLLHPKTQLLQAEGEFRQKTFSRGYRVGLTYDQYLDDEKELSLRTGLNLVVKRYSTQFDVIQSYEDINNSMAVLEAEINVTPSYSVFELPLAFLYKKALSESNSFFSFAGGASLDLLRGSSYRVNTQLELFNPRGIPQRFNISNDNNFEFDSHLSYSLFASASYHFLLRNQRYVELGLSYHFSPVRLDTLNITHNVNGEVFSASYLPQRLSYFQCCISYSLTRLEFNPYLPKFQ
ncbi:hypothetical protein [Catalinimonas niigatensis]|uniref:hypothetical protein n=1 Tax=Catalinimonas niigatensis TaxID=1397264 RepID=UPI0026668EFE|nr:hypothetical protein [Catalinimonas niigatensis]WPP49592.1 hypothetical protein PZB72_23240 [Catalinimonas niigatensis]